MHSGMRAFRNEVMIRAGLFDFVLQFPRRGKNHIGGFL
jgi:hypothetical protein